MKIEEKCKEKKNKVGKKKNGGKGGDRIEDEGLEK